MTDCYGRGLSGPFKCPEGTWCQVESRPNWYPWDIAYQNRGRCVPYAPLYGACEPAFEGQTVFPRKEDGSWFERPVNCGPEDKLVCTGDVIKVLPSMCVEKRLPAIGCMSSAPFCAGRSPGDCAPAGQDFCVCPQWSKSAQRENASTCTESSVVTREKLEHCGSVFNSFNGPNFAIGYLGGGDRYGKGLPNDANIGEYDKITVKNLQMYHGIGIENHVAANDIMKTLWPYKVCNGNSGEDEEDCTKFPLPVLARDPDGGLVGNYTDGTIASWLPETGRGALSHHCSWMILHALSVNGPPLLSETERKAFIEGILYISGQYDCKVCRSNIVQIIELYGLPEGHLRIDYARWFWRAHNHASEHTYATHSPSQQQIDKPNSGLKEHDRRWDMWANPRYEHPWFMTFADALDLWTLPKAS